MLKKFCHDDTGATATEYGLIAAMLGVTMIAGFATLRGEYLTMFEGIADGVVNANNP